MSRLAVVVAALLVATVCAVPLELKQNVAERAQTTLEDPQLLSLLERDAETGRAYLTDAFVDAFLERSELTDAPACCDTSSLGDVIPTVIVPTVLNTDGSPSSASLCFAEPMEAEEEEECNQLGDKCPENTMDENQLRALRTERFEAIQRRKMRETVDCLAKATGQTMKQLIHVDAMAGQVRSKFTDLLRMRTNLKAQLEQARQTLSQLNEEEGKDIARMKAAQAATDKAAVKRVVQDEQTNKKNHKLAYDKFKEEQAAKVGIQKAVIGAQKKDAQEQQEKQHDQDKLAVKKSQEQAQKLKAQLDKVKEQEELTKMLLMKRGKESDVKAKIRANIASLAKMNEENLKRANFSCINTIGCTTVHADYLLGHTSFEPQYTLVAGPPKSSSRSESSQSGSKSGSSSGSSESSGSASAKSGSSSGSGPFPRIDDPVVPKYLPHSYPAGGSDIGKPRHKIEMAADSSSHSGSSSSRSSSESSADSSSHSGSSSSRSASESSKSGSSSRSEGSSSSDSKTINWVSGHLNRPKGSQDSRPIVQVVDKLPPAGSGQIVSGSEGSDSDGAGANTGDDGAPPAPKVIINIKGDTATVNGEHVGGESGEHVGGESSEHASASKLMSSMMSKLSESVSSSISKLESSLSSAGESSAGANGASGANGAESVSAEASGSSRSSLSGSWSESADF